MSSDTEDLIPSVEIPSNSYECVSTVLDSLDALVYVSDFQTYDLIYLNEYGHQVWGEPGNKRCYQFLQSGQNKPCDFCTNDKLIDADGMPTGTYVWEFQNTVTQHWYQCRDQAIRWVDGRLVRMEIAIDITDRKNMELELEAARDEAEKLAHIDSLTGCATRRAFFNKAEGHFALSQRQQTPLSLVMLDIDHFKRINDQFGHTVGDAVLADVGKRIRSVIRSSDICARFGGEEFILLLPETDIHQSEELMLSLKKRLNEKHLVEGHGPIVVTASFGVIGYSGQSNLSELITAADTALYQAKKDGRNCIVLAS